MRIRKPVTPIDPQRIPDSIRYDGWWLVDRTDSPTAKVIKFPPNPSRVKESSNRPGA